MQVIKAWKP